MAYAPYSIATSPIINLKDENPHATDPCNVANNKILFMQLAIVFASSALGEEFDSVVPLLRELVPSLKYIVGCSVSHAHTVCDLECEVIYIHPEFTFLGLWSHWRRS